MSKTYVYVMRDVVQDAYLIKEGLPDGKVRALFGPMFHAFQWDSELEAQPDLVQQQVQGRMVMLEQVNLV